MEKVRDNKQYASYLLQDFGNRTGASVRTNVDANNFIYDNNLNDPGSMGFKLFFRFDTNHGLLANEQHENSTIAYLNRIGQIDRSNLLKKFIEHLKHTSSVNPWLFQAIEGLDELKSKKPWERYNDEARITIGTLETIELAIQSLLSMYYEIVWDEVRGVWVVPVNLRRFDLSIYIYPKGAYNVMDDDDIALGTVPNAKRTYSGEQQNLNEKNVVEHYYVKSPDIYNHICWDLSECEFIPWESGSTFLAVDNNGHEEAVNNFVIKYRYVRTSYRFYRILGDTVYSDYALALRASTFSTGQEQENFWKKMGRDFLSKSLSPITSRAKSVMDAVTTIKDIEGRQQNVFDLAKLKNTGMTILGGLAETAFDKVSREVSGRLQSMFLGNVYGISHDSFINTFTSQSSADFLYNAGRSIKSTQAAPSLSSTTKLPPNDNVYNKL